MYLTTHKQRKLQQQTSIWYADYVIKLSETVNCILKYNYYWIEWAKSWISKYLL